MAARILYEVATKNLGQIWAILPDRESQWHCRKKQFHDQINIVCLFIKLEWKIYFMMYQKFLFQLKMTSLSDWKFLSILFQKYFYSIHWVRMQKYILILEFILFALSNNS